MEKISSEQISKLVEEEFDKNILPNLMDFVRIPNLSRLYDAEWKTNGLLEQACNFVLDWMKKQPVKGLKADIYKEEGLSPCLFGEIAGSTEDAPTVLFYGHIDKQPHFTGWREGLHPTKPVIEGDKCYGRGISDDGYAPFAAIAMVKILQELKLDHPRCVLVFECDEESGSAHLPSYLAKFKDQIGHPSVIFGLDSGCGNYEQLWLTNSLRGLFSITMKIKIINEGVHSGDASGVVPDTFRILRLLLDRVENTETGQCHKDLHVHIPSHSYQSAEKVIEVIGKDFKNRYPFIEGATTAEKDIFECYLNRTWRPTLTVIGVDGLPPTDKAGNVLRPETTVKLSFRLPPTLDPEAAGKVVKKLLSENPPYGAEITFPNEGGAKGWAASAFDQWLLDSLQSGSKTYYKNDMLQYAEGGTIPFLNMIQEKFPDSSFVVTGVLGPNSNAHGPNESLDIPYTKKFICCILQTLQDSYTHCKKKK